MAQCLQSSTDFICNVFCPTVGVLCSEEAEKICFKNDLTFVELARPFCRLTSEVLVRDPANTGITIPVRNLRVRLVDALTPAVPTSMANRILSDVVSRTLPSISNCDLRSEIPSPGSTPWYEAYRECYFQLLKPMDHEFHRVCLSCLIVVSSSQPDPVDVFTQLGQKLTTMLASDNQDSSVRWFGPNILRFYVLLHDAVEGDQTRAMSILQSMKSVYGSSCYLLQINSRGSSGTPQDNSTGIPDPWSQFVLPIQDNIMTQDDFQSNSDSPVSSENTTSFLPGSSSSSSSTELDVSKLEGSFDRVDQHAFTDPLTSVASQLPASSDKAFSYNSLKVVPDAGSYNTSQRSTETLPNKSILPAYQRTMRQFSCCSVPLPSTQKRRGQCLTLGDQESIRTFMVDFVARSLVPHMEAIMRILNDQIVAKRGIGRSLGNMAKKFFGSGKTSAPDVQYNSSNITRHGIYPTDSVEVQTRRLGDLAFLLQNYDLAYNCFQACRRDFNNEHAWLYLAGSMEMAALASFMQGSNKSTLPHFFEAALATYMNTCNLPDYAIRSCMLSAEVLTTNNLFSDAVYQFVKVTHKDSDLGSALMLEQAAYCCLRMRPLYGRKYAFHLVLAGHRFVKAAQKIHAFRCYSMALNIYRETSWTLAKDHIYFTTGRQLVHLQFIKEALGCLENLINHESQQAPATQAVFLREYFQVYKSLQISGENMKGLHTSLLGIPCLFLPSIDQKSTVVYPSWTEPALDAGSGTDIVNDPLLHDRSVVLRGCHGPVPLSLELIQRWTFLEENFAKFAIKRAPVVPSYPAYGPKTRNTHRPPTYVGELAAVHLVLRNTLAVPIYLLNAALLWQVVLPEGKVVHCKDPESTVYAESVKVAHIILEECATKELRLLVRPLAVVSLEIIGFEYTISSPVLMENGGLVPSLVQPLGVSSPAHTEPSLTLVSGIHACQRLQVAGPRLNTTPLERSSVVYEEDKRLHLHVLPARPDLEVEFSHLPTDLLCGEMRPMSMTLTNMGIVAVMSVVFFCNYPELFYLDGSINSDSKVELAECPLREPGVVFLINPTSGHLSPGQSLTLALWIRGPAPSGSHQPEIFILGTYTTPSNRLSVCCLHHHLCIQSHSSIELTHDSRLMVLGGTSPEGQDELCDQVNMLASLMVENQAKGDLSQRCPEFSVTAVTFVATNLRFECVGDVLGFQPSLKPGGRMTFHMLGRIVANSTGKPLSSQIMFSDVPPLYFPSKVWKELWSILNWETLYTDKNFVSHILRGYCKLSLSPPPFSENLLASSPPTQLSIKLPPFSYRLYHPFEVQHDFLVSECYLDMMLEIFNRSSETQPACVSLLQPSNSRDASVALIVPKITSASPSYLWIGKTVHRLSLEPNTHVRLPVRAVFPRPGVYDMDRLLVSLAELDNATVPCVDESSLLCILQCGQA